MTKQNAPRPYHPSRSRTFLWIAAVSAAIAILVHSYLLNEHYGLKFGQATGDSLCNINETFSCAAVSASRYAEFLGIPMALWGALANLGFLILIPMYALAAPENRPAHRRHLLLASGVIAGASIIMGSLSAFALARFCPFCMLTYLLSFLTFGFTWTAVWNSGQGDQGKHSRASGPPRNFVSSVKPLLILVAVLGFAAIVINDQVKKSYGMGDVGRLVEEKVQEWQSNPTRDITPVAPLTKGAEAASAVMTITEFADFRCIHCKVAAPALKAFVNAHPDVRLQFQPWPLDGECNTAISNNNGASCLLARASYCAGKLGPNGWAAHDYIFSQLERYHNRQAVQTDLRQIASAAQIDPAEFETCTQSDEAKEIAQKQAAVGIALNIRGTPSIYVNGKQLPHGQFLPVLMEVYDRIERR